MFGQVGVFMREIGRMIFSKNLKENYLKFKKDV
jgi:hypothetical protein